MKRIFVVVVNWNGYKDTIACVSSILRMNRHGRRVIPVVVDNGSTDGSVRLLQKMHPDIEYVLLTKNLGFTGGNNAGIRYALGAGADAVWLLNNDTVVDKEALVSLVDTISHYGPGIAGSKIYFAAGHEYHGARYAKSERGFVFWYAGGLIDWKNMYASHRGVDEVDSGQYDRTEKTKFVSGCSMMISREVFERIGLLDDRFYLYLEDLDLCLRAKKKGFSLWYCPKSVVWHVNAGSSGGPGNPLHEYYMTRNRLLVGFRYAPVRTKAALAREGLRFLIGPSNVKKKAVIDALCSRWGNQYDPKKYN